MPTETFIKNYEAALASQNWEQVEPLVHSNACVTFSNGSVHQGIDAIKVAYQRNFSLIKNEEFKIGEVHWVHKTSEMAVYVFKFSWQGIINGQQAGGSGRGTAVIVLEQGKWLLIAEQLGAAK